MPKIRTSHLVIICGLQAFLAGCSPGAPKYLAGNLDAVNHTSSAINHFSVNGYGGGNVSPFGYGGGSCCVMLPSEWQPGLMMTVNWEADPDPYAASPALGTDAFRAFMLTHEAKYGHYSATVELPPYEEQVCALEVHFLPCNTIKLSTSCKGYRTPGNPIKEPLVMQEPAVCPN